MFELENRVFIVTGGSRGIGKTTAQLLCERGAKVCITGRCEEALDQAKDDLRAYGSRVITLKQDVADAGSWGPIFGATTEAFGAVHGLVNNAGMHQIMALECTSEEDFDRIMAANAKSVYFGTKAAFEYLPQFVSDEYPGAVVTVSSVAGLRGTSFQSAYSMSKGAAQVFSLAAAREAIDRKLPIRVNTVNPGMVDTDMGAELAEALVENELAKNIDHAKKGLVKSYMGRRFSTPAEVAHSICYLLSNSASHITGSSVSIDGGLSA